MICDIIHSLIACSTKLYHGITAVDNFVKSFITRKINITLKIFTVQINVLVPHMNLFLWTRLWHCVSSIALWILFTQVQVFVTTFIYLPWFYAPPQHKHTLVPYRENAFWSFFMKRSKLLLLLVLLAAICASSAAQPAGELFLTVISLLTSHELGVAGVHPV